MRLSRAFDGSCLISFFFVVVIRIDVNTNAATSIAPTVAASRHLVYPPPMDNAPAKVQLVLGLAIPMEIDESTIMGYVMKYNYKLPHNVSYFTGPCERLRRSATKEDLLSDDLPRESEKSGAEWSSPFPSSGAIGRYAIYKIVESAIDSNFQSGKACLLRAICEAAVTPLSFNNGILAQLIHVFLTPSSTAESYEESIDQEYLAAESIGRRKTDECSRAFRECDSNFLDYFSKIH